MKSVLVTGGCGFIGQRLANLLARAKMRVTVLDDLSTGSGVELDSTVEVVKHDIVYPIPELPRFDTCFHLAAVSRIGLCAADPERAWHVNFDGTLNVLRRCVQCDARMVFASTCAAGGPWGLSVYGDTKRSAEQALACYGDRVVTARLFNVYGPGEPDCGPTSTLVARLARCHREGTLPTVYGDGEQRRDFVHVDDVVDALVLLANADVSESTEPYDVGAGVNYSVNELMEWFGLTCVQDVYRAGEMRHTLAEPYRMKALGWEPKHDLSTYVKGVTGGHRG